MSWRWLTLRRIAGLFFAWAICFGDNWTIRALVLAAIFIGGYMMTKTAVTWLIDG